MTNVNDNYRFSASKAQQRTAMGKKAAGQSLDQ